MRIVILTALFAVGCATTLPLPEFASKTFEPVRGGIIRYERPENGDEQRAYGAKVKAMMRKFCQGQDFKIQSEGSRASIGGSYSDDQGEVSSSAEEGKRFILVKFECLKSKPTSAVIDEK